MDRQALIVIAQLLTGQDQMFSFLPDAPDPARPRLAPHRDKSERLPAHAQVVLVRHPAFVGAHGHHPVRVAGGEEGLSGSVTAAGVLDVVLPLVLVQSVRITRANVAFDEVFEAGVPSGALAGSVGFGKRLMTQQETDGKTEKHPESSHYPAVLESNKHYKVITLYSLSPLSALGNLLYLSVFKQ